ncbi:uncharacterized protein LY79DRAFT_574391 [Colletotrichum navitas]|uniref:Uncharacterized protein n=1 Tax=Colletotrichum navitas TaxID=681940 RepID=A0AAD8QC69_9PEZI|nr:uncharacterized protein LY79DRAFT_574391 [Colletotrichum navitas]KAK1599948.1 hypothetical protein LY79DRAFT_574391 [Colletotrichum navitas]
MPQLVDATDSNATVRVLLYLAIFNPIYLPLWVILGAKHWNTLWSTSSATIPIMWQVILGLTVNSSTVFWQARTAPICVSGASLTLSVGALLMGLDKPSKPAMLSDMPSPAVSAQNRLLPELIVEKHLGIWTCIKGGSYISTKLKQLIAGCDLASRTTNYSANQDFLSRRLPPGAAKPAKCLFTTHFLDKVEVLADEIAILSKGQVKCCRPTTALKQLHGGGYILVTSEYSLLEENRRLD